MSGFHTKTFTKHDDYYTPFSAWDNIKEYIPQDKIIWEAFYGDGESGTHLEKLGFETIHTNEDFFDVNYGDIIISNPPFTKKKEVLKRLIDLDKPFIMILPQAVMNNNYIREWFKDTLQIIIPRRRIQFIKDGNDQNPKKCNFDCFYYCYKMNLPKDIIFLDK